MENVIRLTFHSNLAIALGRPRFVHREDVSTSPPMNCDFPPDPTRTVPIPYNESSFATTMFLLQLAHKIHDVLSGISRRALFVDDHARLMSLHQEICDMRYNMPKSLQTTASAPDDRATGPRSSVSRLRVLNQINVVLVALHRPHVATHPASRGAAINAALHQLQCQQELFEITPYPEYKLYGNAFYTVDAAIFLASIAVEQPQTNASEHNEILHEILKAIERLEKMRDRNHLAYSGAKVLRHFYATIQAAPPTTPFQAALWNLDRVTANGHSDLGDVSFAIPPPQQPCLKTFESLFGPNDGLGNVSDLDCSCQDQLVNFEDILAESSMFDYLTWPVTHPPG